MKRIEIIGYGLLAALVLCAFAVTGTAFGSQVLVKGAELTEELLGETEGELKLLRYTAEKGTTLLNTFLCLGTFHIVIVIPGGNLIWVLVILGLNLNNVAVTVGSLGDTNVEPLGCEVTQANSLFDCKSGVLADIWPVGLSSELEEWWHIELQLVLGVYRWVLLSTNNLGGAVGWEVECELGIGGSLSETCTGAEPSAEETNDTKVTPTAILSKFTPGTGTERATCGTEKEATAFEGSGDTWATGKTEGGTREETTLSE